VIGVDAIESTDAVVVLSAGPGSVTGSNICSNKPASSKYPYLPFPAF